MHLGSTPLRDLSADNWIHALPKRFIFRMVDHRDCARFFKDGELRSKNHPQAQLCHQASYAEIVSRRGGPGLSTPAGHVINDHVAFYFSPLTGMAFAIHSGHVNSLSPDGALLGKATMNDRVFFVADVENFRDSGREYWFSNIACNSLAPAPSFTNNLDAIENHVAWDLFDESPIAGRITEIGYTGCTTWQHNRDDPPRYQNRKQKRMAEFLVRDAVPLSMFDCIICKSGLIKTAVEGMMQGTNVDLPIYVKPGCYY